MMRLAEDYRSGVFLKFLQAVSVYDLVVVVSSVCIAVDSVSHVEIFLISRRLSSAAPTVPCRFRLAYCRSYGYPVDAGASVTVLEISRFAAECIILNGLLDADCPENFIAFRIHSDALETIHIDYGNEEPAVGTAYGIDIEGLCYSCSDFVVLAFERGIYFPGLRVECHCSEMSLYPVDRGEDVALHVSLYETARE